MFSFTKTWRMADYVDGIVSKYEPSSSLTTSQLIPTYNIRLNDDRCHAIRTLGWNCRDSFVRFVKVQEMNEVDDG